MMSDNLCVYLFCQTYHLLISAGIEGSNYYGKILSGVKKDLRIAAFSGIEKRSADCSIFPS
jgi:hypothetical protein